MDKLRVMARMAASAMVVVLLSPLQVGIFAPLGNYETIPRLAGKLLRLVAGVKVDVVGKELLEARFADGQPHMLAANHGAAFDIPYIQELVGEGSFIAKEQISKWPVIGPIARAMGTIFVKKGKDAESNLPKEKKFFNLHTAIVNALNGNSQRKGRNVIIFPEGTTGRGDDILPFHSGGLSVLFNDASHSEEKLKDNVKLQLLAIRLTHVNGKSVEDDPSLRDIYAWGKDKEGGDIPPIEHIRNIFNTKSIRVEIRVLDEMDPRDYKNYEEFTRAAEYTLRRGLLAPGKSDVTDAPQKAPEHQPVFQ